MNIEFREFKGEWDWGWCKHHVDILRVEDTSGIMAIDKDTNMTVGACIMDNWTGSSVQGHFIIPHPMLLKHGFFECCAHYVFEEKGLKSVYAMVPADNEKAVKLNKHLGFTVKTVMEGAFREGVDYLMMEMKRENCRFIDQAEAA